MSDPMADYYKEFNAILGKIVKGEPIVVTIEDQQLSPKQQERAEHLRRAMKRMGHAQ